MSIEKLAKEIFNAIKSNVEIPAVDREELKNIAKQTLKDAFQAADFKALLKECIQEAMVDTEIINPILVDKVIKDVRIVTETRESQEVKEVMNSLSATLKELRDNIREFDYPHEVREAVKKGTENVQIKHAVVTDVEVTNAIITDEEVKNYHIREEWKVEEKPYFVKVPRLREEFIKVKKLIFPDGREAV